MSSTTDKPVDTTTTTTTTTTTSSDSATTDTTTTTDNPTTPRTTTTTTNTTNNAPPIPFTIPSTAPPTDSLPTPASLTLASTIPIYDHNGTSHPFSSLFSNPGTLSLIIFIRHFHCGFCQSYLTALTSSFPSPPSLLTHNPPITISIIGLGTHDLITPYATAINCPYPIYSEPTQKLHSALGLVRTLSLGSKKPSYEKDGVFATIRRSIAQGLTWGNPLRGGDVTQVGGEFLWVGGECVWCHRMKTVRDHTEVDELKKVIGLVE